MSIKSLEFWPDSWGRKKKEEDMSAVPWGQDQLEDKTMEKIDLSKVDEVDLIRELERRGWDKLEESAELDDSHGRYHCFTTTIKKVNRNQIRKKNH